MSKEYVTFKILSDQQKTKSEIRKQTHFYYIKNIYMYIGTRISLGIIPCPRKHKQTHLKTFERDASRKNTNNLIYFAMFRLSRRYHVITRLEC